MKVTRRSLLLSSVVFGVAGCSRPAEAPTPGPTPSSAPPSVAPKPSPSPSPTPALRAPLTGLPVTDPAVLTRPAVAVKVPNLKIEQPQLGINEADIVICQPNGDSSTRLCPIFHSTFAEAVGPVRSMRPADVPLLSPVFPVLGNTGAASWVNNYIQAHSERLEVMTYLDFKRRAPTASTRRGSTRPAARRSTTARSRPTPPRWQRSPSRRARPAPT